MSAINQIEKEIREAVVFLRENNQTIPSATIQFMKDASIEKLKQGQTLPIDSVIKSYSEKEMDNAYDKGYNDGANAATDIINSL